MSFNYPDVLIGSAVYTSFVSLDDAEFYAVGATNFETWNALTDDEKSRFLVSSTRTLDRQNWKGEKTDSDNVHEWPRTGIAGVDDATLPVNIINATIELALALADGSTAQTQSGGETEVKRLKAGSVEIENFRRISDLTVVRRFPLIVTELIQELLKSSGIGAKSSGTGKKSPFSKDFSLTDGF